MQTASGYRSVTEDTLGVLSVSWDHQHRIQYTEGGYYQRSLEDITLFYLL